MDITPNAPRSLILSTRLYQALLAVYPSEFRQAYGGLMLQVFRDCSRRAWGESGHAGLFSLWMRTMLDTVQTALEEHTQRGVDMSKEKFFTKEKFDEHLPAYWNQTNSQRASTVPDRPGIGTGFSAARAGLQR